MAPAPFADFAPVDDVKELARAAERSLRSERPAPDAHPRRFIAVEPRAMVHRSGVTLQQLCGEPDGSLPLEAGAVRARDVHALEELLVEIGALHSTP